jgi:16S rRNA (cytosine967-C5)-methyltransferase
MENRLAALRCLIEILEYDKLYDEIVNNYAKKVVNPAELVNTVSGTVKIKMLLDYFIEKITSKPLSKSSSYVRNILRLGIFELEFLKRPDYAVINSCVALSKPFEKDSSGFINAVLRNFLRKRQDLNIQEPDQVKFLSIKYSHPEWMIEKWVKNFGVEETEKICNFNNSPPKISIRINSLKILESRLIDLFKKNNINFKKSPIFKDCFILKNPGNINKLAGYEDGFWVVQGEASCLVSEILNPQPGETILDFCAAPGSKTLHIASLMKNQGKIVAVDISESRLEKIRSNILRLGVEIIEIMQGDASEIKFEEKFDRVLIDVPCSNTGVLNKRPDARWKRKPEDLKTLAELQLKILNNAANFVKLGGIIVYSTCSIEPEENHLVVEKFLKHNSDFLPEPFKIKNLIDGNDNDGKFQILPSKHDTEGFFIAKFERLSEKSLFKLTV